MTMRTIPETGLTSNNGERVKFDNVVRPKDERVCVSQRSAWAHPALSYANDVSAFALKSHCP